MYDGESVRLRALEMEDLDDIMSHWNDLELRRFLSSTWPHSRRAEHQWLERATTLDPFKDGQMVLAIEDKKTNRFIGTVAFFDISKHHSRAEFGIAIHSPQDLGKGYGTDATRVMLWVGFHIFGLNSIYLVTLDENKRAQKAYAKAGFKRAGVFRQAAFVMGEFHDFVIMDVLKSDFFEQFPPGTKVSDS